MSLPDFSEFTSSIDEETFGKNIDLLLQPHIFKISTDQASLEAGISALMMHTMQSASKITLLWLQTYHEWLQAHLE